MYKQKIGSGTALFDLEDIVASLKEITVRAEHVIRSESSNTAKDDRPDLKGLARNWHKLRALRELYLPTSLLSEPGWDILLYLYAQHDAPGGNSQTSVVHASHAPQATALRWLEKLEETGLLTQCPNPADARGRIVRLTDDAVRRMSCIIEHIATGFGRAPAR